MKVLRERRSFRSCLARIRGGLRFWSLWLGAAFWYRKRFFNKIMARFFFQEKNHFSCYCLRRYFWEWGSLKGLEISIRNELVEVVFKKFSRCCSQAIENRKNFGRKNFFLFSKNFFNFFSNSIILILIFYEKNFFLIGDQNFDLL